MWDWDRPGNIKGLVARINQIRRENPALQHYKNLRFYPADNKNILFYGKTLPGGGNSAPNAILVVVNLDPFYLQHSFVHVPVWDFGIVHDETYVVHDLVTGMKYEWRGVTNYVQLDPSIQPAHIFRLERA